jgi:chromosome segregation ATPase
VATACPLQSVAEEFPSVDPHWSPVRESIVRLRTNQETLAAYVGQLAEQLGRAGREIEQRDRQLAAYRARLSDLESQQKALEEVRQTELHRYQEQTVALSEAQATIAGLRAELAHLRESRDAAQTQLQQQQQELETARSMVNSADGEISLEEFTQLQQQLEHVQQELAVSRSQVAQLAGVTMDLAEARADLARSRDEALKMAESRVGTATPDSELQQRCEASELERRNLEIELESLRQRSVELTEALCEQKRVASEERAEWSGEIRQLRRSLERQSEILAEQRPAEVAPPRPARAEKQSSPKHHESKSADDPVVGSVMAQFATLQKERSRRRDSR